MQSVHVLYDVYTIHSSTTSYRFHTGYNILIRLVYMCLIPTKISFPTESFQNEFILAVALHRNTFFVPERKSGRTVPQICPLPPGRYSLYSDDRDDRRNFLGVVIGDLVFLGVVQEKSFKKIKLVFVRV